jgi:hypothetical protein
VLNDYVAKKNRAKWNALESVNLFSWSGSSILGGYLIREYGFNATFFITCVLQAISVGCLLPLLPLVRAETRTSTSTRDAGAVAPARDTSVAPLPLPPPARQPTLAWSEDARAPSVNSVFAARPNTVTTFAARPTNPTSPTLRDVTPGDGTLTGNR